MTPTTFRIRYRRGEREFITCVKAFDAAEARVVFRMGTVWEEIIEVEQAA